MYIDNSGNDMRVESKLLDKEFIYRYEIDRCDGYKFKFYDNGYYDKFDENGKFVEDGKYPESFNYKFYQHLYFNIDDKEEIEKDLDHLYEMLGQYQAELDDDDNYYIGSFFEDEYNLYVIPEDDDYYYYGDNNPYDDDDDEY